MYGLRLALLVIHITSAAALFSLPLGISRNLKATVALGKAAFEIAAADAARRAKLSALSSLATLWTGVGLIFVMGGFKAAPINYHISLTLMFVAIGVNFLIMRPAIGGAVQAAKQSEVSADTVRAIAKKISMGQGILHLLWVSILFLMLHRITP